ncbi:uncharacterized protein sb:cb1058 [Lampris incognitus]|uniref:uncharacterized protein sb:cb1058 n=1 Tax=Lampris incognitus TaxID=2546036 RepID=UPI0024B5D2A8|nr:uncharacterized protein sb:cb1058 [Lampris incognitus]
MTIGSRKSSVRSSIRAPKFLDKASGFYGRLDEPETSGERDEDERGGGGVRVEDGWNSAAVDSGRGGGSVSEPAPGARHERGQSGVFNFNEGLMEDDGETLLRRRPGRRSSRWRRSSRRKQEARLEEEISRVDTLTLGIESGTDAPALEGSGNRVKAEGLRKMEEGGRGAEPPLHHFAVKEDTDDQVLIRDKKRGREEGEEERRMKREQEEGMKAVKRNTVKNYRKALDRAFRRGWEAFVTNLYSVTLTPVTSSSSSSSPPHLPKEKLQRNPAEVMAYSSH